MGCCTHSITTLDAGCPRAEIPYTFQELSKVYQSKDMLDALAGKLPELQAIYTNLDQLLKIAPSPIPAHTMVSESKGLEDGWGHFLLAF